MKKNIFIVVLILLLIVSINVNVWVLLNNQNKPQTENSISNGVSDNNVTSGTSQNNTTVVEKNALPVYDITKGKKVNANCIYTGEILSGTLDIKPDGTLLVYDNEGKTINTSGITGKIVDAYKGIYGDGATEYIAVILSDGTVELAMYDNTLTFKKVEGLTNIVKLENVMTNRTDAPGYLRATIIAIDADGYFYDIINMVQGI